MIRGVPDVSSPSVPLPLPLPFVLFAVTVCLAEGERVVGVGDWPFRAGECAWSDGGEADGDSAAGVGVDIISLISASMSFVLISCGESLPCWAISISVLVRSTKVSRPSVAERRSMVRLLPLDRELGDVDEVEDGLYKG